MDRIIRFTTRLAIVATFIFPLSIWAQTEITGFFDVIHEYHISEHSTAGFHINQFEIDISKVYKDNISFGAAVAYNNGCENIELSMVYLHYNLFKNGVKHPRRSEEKDEHAGIIIGKFDVPIGLDYLSFASPDRPVVSQPLIIEQTIAGWNDVGLNLHLNKKYFRFNLSAVNGFNKGANFVGDWVFKITPHFRMGLFHTSGFNQKIQYKSWISGAYLFMETNGWELKSEWMRAKGIYGGQADTVLAGHIHNGFYVQLVSDLNQMAVHVPFFITVRYSLWQDEQAETSGTLPPQIERLVGGIGYHLNDYSSLRMEYNREYQKNELPSDRLILQLVVGF